MRANTLLKRIKTACNFVIYGKGIARIMTCGKCGSITIIPITEKPIEQSYIENGKHIDLYWSEFTKCIKCGAVCKEIQMWNFEGDPTKISDNVKVEN